MHAMSIPPSVRAIGRAGAGTNNIPCQGDECTRRAGLQRPRRQCQRGEGTGAGRHADGRAQPGTGAAVRGRTGHPRRRTWTAPSRTARRLSRATSCRPDAGHRRPGQDRLPGGRSRHRLGMQVLGFDPDITVDAAWSLPSQVRRASSVNEVLRQAQFVTLHVPLVDATRHLVQRGQHRPDAPGRGAAELQPRRRGGQRRGAGRARTATSWAPTCATSPGQPARATRASSRCRTWAPPPREAEENCAVMVVDQLRDYLEHGEIVNAVNFPTVTHGARVGLPRRHRQQQRAQHAGADLHRDGACRPEHPQHGQQVARRDGLHAGRRGQRGGSGRVAHAGRHPGVLAVRYLPQTT
jgi:D-3-phosphoglycerate dehydrogenase